MAELPSITFREELGIAWKIALLRLRGQMTYRSSFWMQLTGNFLTNVMEVAVLFVMFYRFDNLGGWSLGEIAMLHGMSMVAFSLGDTITNGIDNVSRQIRSGEFDRTLLRPMGTWITSAVSEVSLRHFGQLLQGVLIFIYDVAVLDIHWTAARVVVLLMAMLTGIALFVALFTVEAILSFWTVNGVEAINAFTYGGSDLAQFPLHIYQKWMRYLFLWVIPVGFVTFYPALYILDRTDPMGNPSWMLAIGPVIVALFCGVVAWGWRQAIRHYRSTGN